MISIRDRLARIVHPELERMDKDETEVPLEQHAMLQQLESWGVSNIAVLHFFLAPGGRCGRGGP